MKFLAGVLHCVLIAFSLSGCILGRPTIAGRLDFTCTVKDASSHAPISGASVKAIYDWTDGPYDEVLTSVVTDGTGRCHLIVPVQFKWMDMNASFGGTVTRRIFITADGYKSDTFNTNPKSDSEKINKERLFFLKRSP